MKTFTFAASAACLLSQVSAQQFVQYTGTTKSNGDDNAVERADPILAPGVISQHVHQIFGANGFAPKVSYESLQESTCTTVGDSAGNGNKQDKSVYWHPALFMEAKDGSGYIRVPTLGHKLYYKTAGTGKKREPFEFPHGFRMLAGNPFMRAPAKNVQRQNITQWICHDSAGDNQGTAGGFPTGISTCDAYPGFNGAVHFPHCWNGQPFNPEDPTAHIVYPIGDIEEGECPGSHPTILPHIFIENQFHLDAVASQVKPDSFVLAMGDNTGYGWHADFFNGWDDGAIPDLMNTCPQGEYGNEDIGDCPSFQAGKANNMCPLKTTFHEKVTRPGQALPGCNPIRDTNPAPFYATAPLGTYSTNCKLFKPGGPPSSGGGHSAPPAGESTTMSQQTTTMATHTKKKKPHHHKTKTTQTTKPTNYDPPSGPPATAGSISCPASNGKSYTRHGKTFQVQCGVDHSGGNLKMVYVNSLGDCVSACAANSQCVDVSLSGTACYMKSALGTQSMNSGVNGAKLVGGGSKHRRHVHPLVHGHS